MARKEKAKAKAEGLPYKSEESLWEVLSVNLSRPIILLTTNFICFILALYQAIIYGFLYLIFTTFTPLFRETYGWSAGVSGLGYLGMGIGFMVATVGGSRLLDVIYQKLKARNGGVAQPEFRIPLMFIGSILVPVGLLWYGWCADKHTHWILPILGSGVFGLGMMLCFFPIQVYLVDAFKYAASAAAATTLLRSLFGFAFPLFADQMFEELGVGPGYSLLAGLSVIIGIPFPVYIYFRGEQLRAKSDLSR
ncbi:hypothetical protein FRC03_003870 [Tulasnella sp. 419]|nr:hypothetical protein FRC03_003870 [Tulasnella sp. 419]